MVSIAFIFPYLLLFLFCKGEQEIRSYCREVNPFKKSDQNCANFNEICVKTGDADCNLFQSACKQCPPSNYSVQMYIDLLDIKMNLKTNEKQSFTQISMLITCLIFVIIILLILGIYLLLKGRSKKKPMYRLKDSKRDEEVMMINDNNVQSFNETSRMNLDKRFLQEIIKTENDKILQEINDMKIENGKKFEMIINENKKLLLQINKMKTENATHPKTIKFLAEGINDKNIDLFVHDNHNVVQVKQRLCAFLLNSENNDYKRMKLKYDGIILDDNDYLLNQIDPSNNNSVNYIIDKQVNTRNIITLKLKGKMRLPEIIQIQRNENIKDFLSTIFNFINNKKFVIYKECTENDQLVELINNTNMNNKNKINDFNLKDGDFIRVVTIEEGELVLKSIFKENESFLVKYQNIDKISTFLERNSSNKDEFILFTCDKRMDENKYLFQFDISNDSQVEFCKFTKIDGINKVNPIHTSKDWEIYFATNKENENILMKKYRIKSENWKSGDWMLNELKTFLITKSHPRFILLNGVYVYDNWFYVSMENMVGGTLGYYLKKNKEFDSKQIIKWAAQILEGIDFLHQRQIIHRDLNPSNILVGDNNDLKLSNCNLSKCGYVKDDACCSILGKDDKLFHIKVRYMSPEILDSREYGYQCDVWSFGAVLVRIVSGAKPYPKLTNDEAKEKIINTAAIEYDFPSHKHDNKIKQIIDSCFGKDPYFRLRIPNLIKSFQILLK